MARLRKYTDDFHDFWENVDCWREKLANNLAAPLGRPQGMNIQPASAGGPGNESLNRLENAWAQCAEFSEWPGIKDRGDAKRISRSPLGVLFGYVDIGLYPPPEVLLALMERYEAYMQAKGGMDLEAAFFGKPVQSAGNFAKRSAKRSRDLDIAMRVAIQNKNGDTDATAAEAVSGELEEDGIELDSETVLKIANTEMPRMSRKK